VTSVSILIPTHNRAALLERTIASLAACRVPAGVSVELVVVANACTDDTPAVVDRIVRSGSVAFPVRCVVEPVAGLGVARNRACREAKGEILALLDDDIAADPGWLESLVRVFATTPAAMVAGRIDLWWEAVERPAWLTPGMANLLSCLDLGPEVVEMTRPDAVGANFALRRGVFETVGPFRTDLDRVGTQLLGGGETFLVMQAMRAGHRLFYAPGAYVKHWVAPGRVSEGYLARVSGANAYVLQIIKPRYGLLSAARALLLGSARFIGHTLAGPLWRLSGDTGRWINSRVRRAIGAGQVRGAIARLRNGPLKPRP
jgi:glycosyltransferase involved in cell wall biosynthesis